MRCYPHDCIDVIDETPTTASFIKRISTGKLKVLFSKDYPEYYREAAQGGAPLVRLFQSTKMAQNYISRHTAPHVPPPSPPYFVANRGGTFHRALQSHH